jgi:hypothetical protein
VITINIPKAKDIAHGIRREARAAEFAPHDEVIAKQIPGNDLAAVEAERESIRVKYAGIQAEIDASNTTDEIKAALGL